MCGAPSNVPKVVYGLCLPRFHACHSWRVSIRDPPGGVKSHRVKGKRQKGKKGSGVFLSVASSDRS